MKIISLATVFLVLLLNSCGSIYQVEPVGIDKHEEALKRSPCACLEVKMLRELPDFMLYSVDGV